MDLATGAVGSIISMLADVLKAEYNLQSSVKEQVESLTKELMSAQAFLQDIDKVPPDQLDEQVKLYACEVREASYDMEDVLDTFLVSVQGPEPIEKKKKKKKKKKKLIKRLQEKMTSFFSKTAARHGIDRAIDNIMKRLQEMAERRGRYTVDSIVTRPSPSSVVDTRLVAMYKQVTQLIGIEKSRDELASVLSSQLGDEMSNNKLKIVSVVGVGGLGKTSLAKALYEDLKGQFSCWAFVPVGRNPDPKKVLRDILIELDKDKYTDPKFIALDERQLINELRVFLEEKRYFIVIDDVWDIKSWETISWTLVENNNGSRIIITTRNLEVATGAVYKLQPLSDDSSKKLLYTRIFSGEDEYLDNQRHKISGVADKILKKCGGVPLAIITMGSYLVGKSVEEWLEVCNSIGFCGKDKEQTGDTEWILSLSYYDLPSHLKTCLLYLSVFPEDYLIRKDPLIWMWIAEGFVHGEQGTGLFEIGEGYFNHLINRSLIQPVEEELSKVVEGCRVHDMILDLIRSLSRKENFVMVLDNSGDTILGSQARRLALQNRVLQDTTQENHTIDKARARSLIGSRCNFGSRVLQSFTLLRMLFLEDCLDVLLDEHVNHLHHLRCLGIRRAGYLVVPKELGALKFLQVLYLEDNAFLESWQLPSSVGMLTQLVCLRAPRMTLPGGIIKDLTSLQELHINGADKNDDKARGQTVKDLGNLRELRVLSIDIFWMDERMQSDLLNSLGNLQKLQRLRVYFDSAIEIDATLWNKGLPLLPRGLCQLDISIAGKHGLPPPCIDPSRLSSLSHLTLRSNSIDDQGLKILGGLPELCYLMLDIDHNHRATLTSTAAHVYFKKLRSCFLRNSIVHFVVNKEELSVSIDRKLHPSAFSSKKEQDRCRVARSIMPNLEALSFSVHVGALTACKNGSCNNLGLEYLASLQKVTVFLHCWGAPADVVQKEVAALRHAIQVHPNRPTLNIVSTPRDFLPIPVNLSRE